MSSSSESLISLFYGTHRQGSPSIGWGPAYFGASNRLSPELDHSALLLYGSFAAAYAAFAFAVLSSRSGRRASTFWLGSVLGATALALAMGFTEADWYSAAAV